MVNLSLLDVIKQKSIRSIWAGLLVASGKVGDRGGNYYLLLFFRNNFPHWK